MLKFVFIALKRKIAVDKGGDFVAGENIGTDLFPQTAISSPPEVRSLNKESHPRSRPTGESHAPFHKGDTHHTPNTQSVHLHEQLNLVKAIARLCSAIGQLQLSSSTWRQVNRFIGRSMSYLGAIGGAVPISTSGNRVTG